MKNTIKDTHVHLQYGEINGFASMYKRRHIMLLIAVAALVLTQGCHSGGGAGPIAAEEGTYNIGYFIDSPVEGLEYYSITFAGITDSQGGFLYNGNEEMTFFLGGVVLGRINAQRIITPVDLGGVLADTSSTRVINIARLLQSLDDDLIAANGIRIPEEVREALKGIRVDFDNPELDNDAGVREMFDRLNNLGIYPEELELGLLPTAQTQLHLENTITQIEQEEAEAEEALRNLRLSASISFPYASVLMIQGQVISLQGYVYGGKQPYTYSWRIDDGSPFSTRLRPGNYPFRTQGAYTIIFTATDSVGDTSTAIRHVNVFGPETQAGEFPADSIPTVGIVSPSPGNIPFKAGETVTFEAFINSGNTPLYYGWSVGSVPANTYDPRTESITYISPRTFIISQDITLNAQGEYPIYISTQDTPYGGKGPDQHAASVRVKVE